MLEISGKLSASLYWILSKAVKYEMYIFITRVIRKGGQVRGHSRLYSCVSSEVSINRVIFMLYTADIIFALWPDTGHSRSTKVNFGEQFFSG